MRSVWQWLHAKDWRTWLGHLLQGVVITGLAMLLGLGFESGVYATVVHFLLREAPGVYFAVKANDTPKLVDGVLDFLAPVVGIWIALVLFG